MFDIEICEARSVVLVRFRGVISEGDFRALDGMVSRVRGEAGYDCVFDMTAIERIDLATEFVAARGELPQAFKDRQRIYVVANDDLKLLVRLYAAYQESKGWRAPQIVATLAQALKQVSVDAGDFHPLTADQ